MTKSWTCYDVHSEKTQQQPRNHCHSSVQLGLNSIDNSKQYKTAVWRYSNIAAYIRMTPALPQSIQGETESIPSKFLAVFFCKKNGLEFERDILHIY